MGKPAATNKDLSDRDVVLSKAGVDDGASTKMTVLLQDVLRLHAVLRKLQGKAKPKKEADLTDLADSIVKFLKEGKEYELAGLKGVPRPFLQSTGRIVTKDSVGRIKDMPDKDAKVIVRKMLFEELKKDDAADIPVGESPYKEYKDILARKTDKGAAGKPIVPASKDALLLRCNGPVGNAGVDKLYEHHSGNRVVFNLASQLVSTSTTDSDTRIKAALAILAGLDDAKITPMADEEKPPPKASRLLVRTAGTSGPDPKDENAIWDPLDGVDAAEFALGFVFEVALEKEIPLVPTKSTTAAAVVAGGDAGATSGSGESVEASKEPVPDPTEHDVLFGRGGMTNSHSGNRRFRDIIALHRPE